METEPSAAEWWNAERILALDLALVGFPKVRIARELGVHRNTINLWCAHPLFRAAFHERQSDQAQAIYYRRVRTTSHLLDRLARQSLMAMDAVEADPHNRTLRRTAFAFMRAYRRLRDVERKDFGCG